MVKKMTEGVGKKIVEALKRQSEIGMATASVPETPEIVETQEEIADNVFDEIAEPESEPQNDILSQEEMFDEPLQNPVQEEEYFEEEQIPEQKIQPEPEFNYEPEFRKPEPRKTQFTDLREIEEPVMQAFNYHKQKSQENLMIDLETFEIPSNIAVLKNLISQLPSGVSKHTGAQIIKQTMEALGISMKGVLQEAQQVQEGLNSSAKECMSNIQEYKKQIQVLEKQAQNYHRQYTALNDLISLFIQTGV